MWSGVRISDATMGVPATYLTSLWKTLGGPLPACSVIPYLSLRGRAEDSVHTSVCESSRDSKSPDTRATFLTASASPTSTAVPCSRLSSFELSSFGVFVVYIAVLFSTLCPPECFRLFRRDRVREKSSQRAARLFPAREMREHGPPSSSMTSTHQSPLLTSTAKSSSHPLGTLRITCRATSSVALSNCPSDDSLASVTAATAARGMRALEPSLRSQMWGRAAARQPDTDSCEKTEGGKAVELCPADGSVRPPAERRSATQRTASGESHV